MHQIADVEETAGECHLGGITRAKKYSVNGSNKGLVAGLKNCLNPFEDTLDLKLRRWEACILR